MTHTQTRRAGAGGPAITRNPRYGRTEQRHPPTPSRGRHAQAALRFATGGALMIALAAALFTVQGLTQLARSQSRVAALQADVNRLTERVRGDERAAAADQRHVRGFAATSARTVQTLQRLGWQMASLPTETEVARMRSGLALYAACIPELQREIEHLGIAWRINPAKPGKDYFKAFTAATVSRPCSAALGGR